MVAVLSVLFYYGSVLGLCTNSVASLLQPQLNGVMSDILSSYKVWIVLAFVPFLALGPDIILVMYNKVFKPTPSDRVIELQKREEKTVKL